MSRSIGEALADDARQRTVGAHQAAFDRWDALTDSDPGTDTDWPAINEAFEAMEIAGAELSAARRRYEETCRAG